MPKAKPVKPCNSWRVKAGAGIISHGGAYYFGGQIIHIDDDQAAALAGFVEPEEPAPTQPPQEG